ncbi:MAG: hypothetical protein NC483_00450 [Ruminococcus sp.]|nr:hypothetical protein [Ruminococcus sp.]
MKVEVKEYLKIGICRSMNIEVYKYDEVKELKGLSNVEPLYKGSVDDAPREIREMTYVKCNLGKTTIYYV